MKLRRALATIVLLAAPLTAHANAEIDSFLGQWRGVEVRVEGTPAPELTPGDLDLAITPEDGGFRVRALTLDRGPDGSVVPRRRDAVFAPTETPGVFAIRPGSRSLLSRLFADPAVGNPLEGDTLLWARVEADALHVYSLAIDDKGGYALEQSTWRLTDAGMESRDELRSQNDRVVVVEGRLERAGG